MVVDRARYMYLQKVKPIIDKSVLRLKGKC